MKSMPIKLDRSNKVIILTGAGISAESGLKTFRDANGLWENYKIEEVATADAFYRNPDLVMNFYKDRYNKILAAQPNSAHTALALMENELKENFLLITQNIDDLHQRAGNKRILQMHGEISKARCVKCGHIFENYNYSDNNIFCPSCKSTSRVRPHIIWFGETPLFMEQIQEELKNCKLFISIGTSGTVYPAAQFVDIAHNNGATTLLLNLEAPENSFNFDHHIYGKASDTVIRLVHTLLTEGCK